MSHTEELDDLLAAIVVLDAAPRSRHVNVALAVLLAGLADLEGRLGAPAEDPELAGAPGALLA